MDQEVYFHIRNPQVVHDTINDETVIVNLLNGNYYDVKGVGSVIWQMIANGASHQQIAFNLTHWYSGDPLKIQSQLDSFLSQLASEGLIIEAVNPDQTFSVEQISFPSGRPPFSPPNSDVEVFSDMQNLLLLDPVHEVTEKGWPHPEPDEDSSDQNTND